MTRPAVVLISKIISLPAVGQDSTFILTTHQLSPYTPTYIGNGNFSLASSQLGTKGTESYMAWVYDHGKGDIPRIAALPAWNEIDFNDGTRWLSETPLDPAAIHSFQQTLNMYDGVLATQYNWMDGDRSTSIDVETFVSRSDRHIAVVQCTITPHFSG